ncbi:MAG: acetyl-CoA carboxylase biotin carboxyl carrier protein [Clostridia bacterium]|nr:acetyl-CoA carboxylase biotin carboxyl carrier protein [Clostridia bacterium]
MDYKQIKKLMDDMGESKLDSLEIEFPDGIKISMTKNSRKDVQVKAEENAVIAGSAPISVPVVQKETTNSLVVTEPTENFKVVKSPMVGTFYASSAPDKDPFVKVGDKVKKGQVLCIVEAMKLMNEIESEFDGEIVEICVENEEVVEYGKPLFKIK